MKYMSSDEVRQAFLDYFASQGHQPVTASSLVPGNDPTLLFTNAGMVQFKDVFLGTDKRPYTRAATSQKCMRISGKHNDLENVGPSPRHHTFFEMLGNFSFGDYFKQDAIKFGYELLTEVYGLPPERLAFTVYETDDEAYNVWVDEVGVDPKRVARMGPKTNFWQMADTGPCGPTSEIHWDNNPELGVNGIIPALMEEDDRFLELWNLVFMQFNRTQPDDQHTGKFDEPLPSPGVDTGMGLERILAVIQGVKANYDTDLFTDIMDATQEILGHDDNFREENYVAYRVIADHIRAASFLIADGVNPGTNRREYVTRMLIRRAMLFAYRMGVENPFLYQVAEAVIHKMGSIYPELVQFQEAIRYQISTEEERFLRTLEHSLGILDGKIEEMKSAGQTEMSGEDAFFLHDTHGLPLEITRDMLQEHDLTVDEAGFEKAREEHAQKSGVISDKIEVETIYPDLLSSLQEVGKLGDEGVVYNPYDYDRLSVPTTVLAIIKDGELVESAKWEDEVEIVLAETPFYVESGGQVSDKGVIVHDDWEIEVTDMRQPVGGLIIHVGEVTYGDTVRVGDNATARVNHHRRWDIMRNHTATHLLHASLRNVLGEHVRQKGSLVAPDRLRFDFTHNAKVAPDELERINNEVNEMILANQPLEIVFKSLGEARREGAMALFGEKYGDTVRTISIYEPESAEERWSYELCGGTHVRSTAEIGPFLITGQESSSAGVRRIEAITGHKAQKVIQERLSLLDSVADRLKVEPDIAPDRVEELQADIKTAQQTIEQLQKQSARDELEELLVQAVEIDGVKVIAAKVSAADGDLLGELADWCRDRIDSGVVTLGSEIEGKARLVAKVTPDLVKRGVHAGNLIKHISSHVKGGGGGRPDFATAGGKDPAGILDALGQVEAFVREAISG